ncbi:DUF1858 domain-containing protein [Candidatus Woesearchaeota archaeon]|nr:DUF1858 domain-containing protein [Candidatus Woesearchaeota archaeon]
MAIVKIHKGMTMGEIVGRYPQLAGVIMEKYNLHCIGCGASTFETLEQGALGHGMSKKQMQEMVEHLNSIITKKSK